MNLFDYEVEDKEILQRVVKVKATCKEHALNQVRQQYLDEKIVLDGADLFDSEISVL